uniref:DDE-1 domain-containing protein n=1 Tax=Amphimedon queenslandica TaxID=400682 RepID=A0A1X7SIC0_AMPQE
MGTTARLPVPKGLYDESRSDSVIICISWKIHNGSTWIQSVPIKGLSDKCNITLTFTITLAGMFFHYKLFMEEKTEKSQPRGFKFISDFLVLQNTKHWSNEEETLKLVDNIISPFVVKKREEMGLSRTQKALVIWDVFKGQVTDKVLKRLDSLHIEFIAVPANMTHFFQPLDFTVNKSAKQYMRREFVMYYSNSVREQLASGKEMEDIDVDFRLTTIKPLHAQ